MFTEYSYHCFLLHQGEDLNESVSERTAASTVFTFVDRQMSGVTGNDTAGGATTDAALAQLYAYIQALPESHNKRRLIKQFNRENGNGTVLFEEIEILTLSAQLS